MSDRDLRPSTRVAVATISIVTNNPNELSKETVRRRRFAVEVLHLDARRGSRRDRGATQPSVRGEYTHAQPTLKRVATRKLLAVSLTNSYEWSGAIRTSSSPSSHEYENAALTPPPLCDDHTIIHAMNCAIRCAILGERVKRE